MLEDQGMPDQGPRVVPRGGSSVTHEVKIDAVALLTALIANFESACEQIGSDEEADSDDDFTRGRVHAFNEAIRVCTTLLKVASKDR